MRCGGTDQWINVLSFLGCNEWRALVYTSKYFASILKCRFMTCIKRFAILRLRKILQFLDFDHFTRLMRREGGEIGGSIHIQLLTTDFQSNDIDIFVYTKHIQGFSPLQRYLYSLCGYCQNATYSFNYVQFWNDFHIMQKLDFSAYRAYQIISVWNYLFQVCPNKYITLQVVSIFESPDENFIPMHKRIKHAIGDFTITQSAYNGRCYNVYGIEDIWKKHIVCTKRFGTSLFADKTTLKHKLRVKKYESRGFTLTQPISYLPPLYINLQNNSNK